MKKITKKTKFPILDAVTFSVAAAATSFVAYKHIKNAYELAHKEKKLEKRHNEAIKDISEKEIRVVAEEPVYANEYIAATADSINIDKVKSESDTVYVTEKGLKYHTDRNCIYLKNCDNIIEKPLSEAESNGLKPCVKCYGR